MNENNYMHAFSFGLYITWSKETLKGDQNNL